MVNYKNSKIYYLYLKETHRIFYVGSTSNHLSTRISGHRSDRKNYVKRQNDPNSDVTDRDLCNFLITIEPEDFDIGHIIDYPCNNITERHKMEGQYQVVINDLLKKMGLSELLNMRQAGRTDKELGSTIIKCECGMTSRKDHLERHRKRQIHHERMARIQQELPSDKSNEEKHREFKAMKKASDAKYKANNKEKITVQRKIQAECQICGETTSKDNIQRHLRNTHNIEENYIVYYKIS